MQPPEFNMRIRLHRGDGSFAEGFVAAYDYECIYVHWADGDLIPMLYADLADLRAMGTLEVLGAVPDFVFPKT